MVYHRITHGDYGKKEYDDGSAHRITEMLKRIYKACSEGDESPDCVWKDGVFYVRDGEKIAQHKYNQ